jgi:hypothetical protein
MVAESPYCLISNDKKDGHKDHLFCRWWRIGGSNHLPDMLPHVPYGALPPPGVMLLRSVTVTPEYVVRNGVLIILLFVLFSPLLQSGEMSLPIPSQVKGSIPLISANEKDSHWLSFSVGIEPTTCTLRMCCSAD